MKPTTKTPARQLPARAAKVNGRRNNSPTSPTTSSLNPATPRSGRRVVRNSGVLLEPVTPSLSGSGSKRRATSPHPKVPVSNKRQRRQATKSVNYRESSVEGDDDLFTLPSEPETDDDQPFVLPDSDTKSVDEPLHSPTVMKSKTSPSRRSPSKTAVSSSKTVVSKTKKSSGLILTKAHFSKKLTPKRQANVAAHPPEDATVPVIPLWMTLPYHVLDDIFQFAVGTPVSAAGAKWLCDTSMVCKNWNIAALTVLWRQPPMLTLQMAHGVELTLSNSPDVRGTNIDYRVKVRCLEIEDSVAGRFHHKKRLDFKSLFRNCHLLEEVYIWHEKDQAPYREINKNNNIEYVTDLFKALGIDVERGHGAGPDKLILSPVPGPVPRLKAWLWSRRILKDILPQNLDQVHRFPAFQGLEKLIFRNFQVPSLKAKNPDDPAVLQVDGQLIRAMARSIDVDVLPNLKHLVLECSTVVTGQFLSLLPKMIERLELINCWEITTEHMAEYLLTHGNALRHLKLDHNQNLSMGFLSVLRDACPKLESLRMNLTYYQTLFFYRDSDPGYDALLTLDQVPTWPATLRHLDLKNLRKWDKPVAEMFFQSLVDSAPDLLKLRHLEIKAMLDIPFRERSRLRDKWGAKLNHVFLRKWVDPLDHFTMRPKPPIIAADPPQKPSRGPRRNKKTGRDSPPTRRSDRKKTISSAPGPSSRASSTGRVKKGMKPSYAEPDTDEDTDDDDESSEDPDSDSSQAADEQKEDEVFVQGMCEVVDLRFDNQKPVEHQFGMEDFLDDNSNDPTDDDYDEANELEEDY